MRRGLSVALAMSFIASGCAEDPSSVDTRNTTASGATATTTNGDSAAEVCVATINQLRATKGLQALARWSETETCADGQAAGDGATNRAHGAFGKCGEAAQNECPGWPGPPATMIPRCLESMWGEGPGGGHYEAMSSRLYTKISCGFGTAPDGSIWAVQNFH